MRTLMGAASLALTALLSLAPPAHTTDTGEVDGTETTFLTVGNDGNGGGESTSSSSEQGESTATTSAETQDPITWILQDACETVGTSGCLETYTCPDGSPARTWIGTIDGEVVATATQCPGEEPPTETTVVDIPGEVVRAFKEVTLPESTITIQPPGGKTLVNLPTIMSTKAQAFTKTVNLKKANVTITLDIVPTSFTWNHGDKTSQSTTDPGGMFAQRSTAAAPMCSTGADTFPCITHTYVTAKNKLGVSVDTTWSATYQVNGSGPWKEVDDTVTIVGAAQELSVLEAKPQLVLK